MPMACFSEVLQEILRSLRPGELSAPRQLGEVYVLMRLEQLKPARFDEAMREQMQKEALDAFLEERVNLVLKGQGFSIRFITIPSHERTPTETFEGLLRRYAAFRELGEERLSWLASRARPFHCTVGQELLRPERMPEFCFCIVEVWSSSHDDPGLRRPSPGLLPAQRSRRLVRLVRRSPCK